MPKILSKNTFIFWMWTLILKYFLDYLVINSSLKNAISIVSVEKRFWKGRGFKVVEWNYRNYIFFYLWSSWDHCKVGNRKRKRVCNRFVVRNVFFWIVWMRFWKCDEREGERSPGWSLLPSKLCRTTKRGA